MEIEDAMRDARASLFGATFVFARMRDFLRRGPKPS